MSVQDCTVPVFPDCREKLDFYFFSSGFATVLSWVAGELEQ